MELSSPSLPTPLLRNKEKECVEKAKEHLGEPQVKHIYEVIHSFILLFFLFFSSFYSILFSSLAFSLTHSAIFFLSS